MAAEFWCKKTNHEVASLTGREWENPTCFHWPGCLAFWLECLEIKHRFTGRHIRPMTTFYWQRSCLVGLGGDLPHVYWPLNNLPINFLINYPTVSSPSLDCCFIIAIWCISSHLWPAVVLTVAAPLPHCSAASHRQDPPAAWRAAVGVAVALVPGVPQRGLVAAGDAHLVEEGQVHGQGQGKGN